MKIVSEIGSASVLVVDDDGNMRCMLALALESAGYSTATAGSAADAIALFARHVITVVFVDARLPDMNGWELIEALRRLRPQTRMVMISGFYFTDDPRVSVALQTGEIHTFLGKPFKIDDVISLVSGLGDADVAALKNRVAMPALR